MQPLVSIVLCTYNGEKFLREQLNSLLRQTHSNLEIIISDDASTDRTYSILLSYASENRIKIFRQDSNTGPSYNFAFALQKATGDFIAFCDQDDIWMENKVTELLSAIQDKLLVYGNSILVNENGEPVGKKLSDLRNMNMPGHTKGFIFSNVAWGHTIMINKKLLSQVLPSPKGIPHDIWMAYKAAALGSIQYNETPLTYYRQHKNTFTVTLVNKPVTRTVNQRFLDFQKQLHWIVVMKDNAAESEKEFYETLQGLYAEKKTGRYQLALLFFLMKHRKELFAFKRKKWISQVIDIFKQPRGEKDQDDFLK